MGKVSITYRAESISDLADGLQERADTIKHNAETFPPVKRSEEHARARGLEEAADIVRNTTIASS